MSARGASPGTPWKTPKPAPGRRPVARTRGEACSRGGRRLFLLFVFFGRRAGGITDGGGLGLRAPAGLAQLDGQLQRLHAIARPRPVGRPDHVLVVLVAVLLERDGVRRG